MSKQGNLVKEMFESLPTLEFRNKHGELFTLHFADETIFMSGDEVDMMVADEHKIAGKYISFFNPDFSIWGPDELAKIGELISQHYKGAKQ